MLDEAPWTELVKTDSFAVMTLDLIVYRKPSQVLGVTFKLDPPSTCFWGLQETRINYLLFSDQVVVDIVERGTPAYISKLIKGDILMAVQGIKVTSMSHASKLLKASGRRFTIRVERKRYLANMNVRIPP
jgi:predicted metalloprotease with PDZ domain